jgi:hypothetical protein
MVISHTAPRRATRRTTMEFAATLMLAAIALYLLTQVEDQIA